MVVDLLRETDKGYTYLVPKQVSEMMKNLDPLVEKFDTDYPSKILTKNSKKIVNV